MSSGPKRRSGETARNEMRRRLAALAGILYAVHLVLAQGSPTHPTATAIQASETGSVIVADHGPNTPSQQSKHYVVLVSLDGFRWDYASRYGARNLLAMALHGASAPQGMLPSYPSTTFPNHYTLVTGLYPEHHGIVAMSFYDAALKRRYANNDAVESLDGKWYGGTPLWILAEQQGMRTACLFWPGSEAAIQGVRPTYYLHFDDKFPDEKRIDQVLAWLRLPETERPHFITLYYSNADHAGHETGPDSLETKFAVHHLDALIGSLRKRLGATHLPIDLVVVSDHGMERQDTHWIDLDTYADLSHFLAVGSLLYPQTEADAQRAYEQLKKADAAFMVYRRANVPASLHYSSNPREGDPVIVPTGPFAIRAHSPNAGEVEKAPSLGSHGYDARQMPSMKAIFYAEGPDIRPGITLKPFENVNVYPFLAHILGLDTPPTDGSLSVLSRSLVDQGEPRPAP